MRLKRGDVVLVLFPDSVVMTDNLATVLETEIDRVIGNRSQMQAVDAALRHTLGL
jgi:mRNA interferase MazF